MDRRLFLEGSLAAGVTALSGVASASPTAHLYDNDRIAIRVGLGLVRPMFRRESPSPLITAIQCLRRELAETGVALPPVRVHDLPSLPAEAFLIVIDGRVLARGEIPRQQLLDASGQLPIMDRLAALVKEHAARFPPPEIVAAPIAMASQPSIPLVSTGYCRVTN